MMLYMYDSLGNYIGEHEHVKYAPVPPRSTDIEPPEGDHPVWTGSEWELRAEPVAPPPEVDPIEAMRAEATVTKRVLALEMLQRGHMSAEDAVAVARGQWPSVLLDYIATLPPEQVAVAEIEFAGSNVIERVHPTTQLFQQFFEMSDEEADAIFGIGVEP